MLVVLEKVYLLRLRKILLCDCFFYIILGISLLISFCRINLPLTINYKLNEKEIEGIILEKNIDGNKLELTIKGKDKIKSYYYFETKKEKELIISKIHLGDKLLLKGNLEEIEENKTKNLFDYKKYMKRQNIYYYQEVEEITLLSRNKNIFYNVKEKVISMCTNKYVKIFILGDKSDIDKKVINSYRELGISHLFAISGMHITLLSSFLLKMFKKIRLKEEKRYLIVSLFLVFYLFLTGLSASVLRAVLFFILFSINDIYYFYIKNTNIFILIFSISLLINPNYLFDVGFLYSYSISYTLIYMSSYINTYNSYFKKLLITSCLSFIVSIPISLYYFNQINFLSIVYNLFYVPFISYVVFPLSLFTFIYQPLERVLNIFIVILEKSSLLLSDINILKFIFSSINIIYYLVYIFLIITVLKGLKSKKNFYILSLIFFLIFHYINPLIFNKNYLMMIDVGQGDSILIHFNNKSILIDTGGVMNYYEEKWQIKKNKSSIVLNTTIPLLKKLGISKLDYLVLTHGDDDHMGESINLVNNFQVNKVIFNNGEYNDLEQKLIKTLEEKNISYYQNIKELNLGKNKLYFLNNKLYDDENNNSSVIYTKLNGVKLLLMGDAGINVEKDLIKKYNLEDIDILKVGHHGSKTSSSKDFINAINPKYSLISVGKDNKFNHPNSSVLQTLKNSKIYRTDLDGSITFKIKNDKLKIETYAP